MEKQSKELSFTSFIKCDQADLMDLNENHQKILKIHKVAHFFLKHHKRIKYQYSLTENGDFKMAFIKEGLVKNIDMRKLNELFYYGQRIFKGFTFVSYMTWDVRFVGADGTVEAFSIGLDDSEARENTNMHYHISGLLRTVSKLPQHSALLEADILNFASV